MALYSYGLGWKGPLGAYPDHGVFKFMTYIVMAYIPMAYVVMVYIIMVYIVMAATVAATDCVRRL